MHERFKSKYSKFSIVFLCILLLFSIGITCTFATETSSNENFTFSSYTNATQQTNGNKTTVTIPEYEGMAPEMFTMTPTETAVYKITMKGQMTTSAETIDARYRIQSSKGDVRLAGTTDGNGKYQILTTETNGDSTSVYVVLQAGTEYTVTTRDIMFGNTTLTLEKQDIPKDKITMTDIPAATVSNRSSYENEAMSYTLEPTGEFQEVSYTNQETNHYLQNGGNMNGAGQAGDLSIYQEVTGSENGFLKDAADLASEYVVNPFEETICELMLGAGDFFVETMNNIIGEDVTISALVYNKVDSVNPNFFDSSVAGKGITTDVKVAISDWYDVLKLIAISFYFVALLAIGVNVLLSSTAGSNEKAKESLTEWLKGFIILTFMPYVIKYAFLINEDIVNMLAESIDADTAAGTTFGDPDEWSVEEPEFRSPDYVSRYTGAIEYGSFEASESYMRKVPTFKVNGDLMRIMRAYAGVTKKFVYAVVWWILIGQVVAFLVMYYKRYFVIAFLIVCFPIVCAFQAVSIGRGMKGPELGSWMKELFSNIFMQMIQAIIYTIITSVCVSTLNTGSDASINWILIILAINFVSEGEKILKKILGAMATTVDDVGKHGQGVKGAIGKAKDGVKKVVGTFGG